MDWTTEQLKKLRKLRKDSKKGWPELGTIFKTSKDAVRVKYKRINWKSFESNPSTHNSIAKKWTNEEMIQLDTYLQAGSSYGFIAEKLGRSIPSVERQAQETDWKAWREINHIKKIKS